VGKLYNAGFVTGVGVETLTAGVRY